MKLNLLQNKCIDCEKLIYPRATRCKSCSNSIKQKGVLWTKIQKIRHSRAMKKRRESGIGSQSYSAVHKWIREMCGKPKQCEFDRLHKNRHYEWALIRGNKYEKKVENFMELCIQCHREYDGNMPLNKYLQIKKNKNYVQKT